MNLAGVGCAIWLAATFQANPPGTGSPEGPPRADAQSPASPSPPERRTPDLVLLRVQASFLERDVRADYSYEDNERGARAGATTAVGVRLAVPLDPSFMLAVATTYEWLDARDRPNENGAGGSVLGRLELAQNEFSSYAFGLRLGFPDKAVGNDKTSIGMTLSGFEDLDALLGLDRVGLYADLGFQHSTGRGQIDGGNELNYALSLAKTWGEGAGGGWQVSPFFELAGATSLDQGSGGTTVVSITPGLRIDPAPGHAFLGGVDFPLSHPHGFSQVFRVSYIFSF